MNFQEVLQHMSDSGVKPTVRSFNAILKSIVQNKVRHGSNGGVMNFLEIFDEMKILGIGKIHPKNSSYYYCVVLIFLYFLEPTLASWLSFLQYIGWDDCKCRISLHNYHFFFLMQIQTCAMKS